MKADAIEALRAYATARWPNVNEEAIAEIANALGEISFDEATAALDRMQQRLAARGLGAEVAGNSSLPAFTLPADTPSKPDPDDIGDDMSGPRVANPKPAPARSRARVGG